MVMPRCSFCGRELDDGQHFRCVLCTCVVITGGHRVPPRAGCPVHPVQAPPACDARTHWWARTPPRPYDPPGHVDDEATCVCGRYRYSQQDELLRDSARTGVCCGTFVPAETEAL